MPRAAVSKKPTGPLWGIDGNLNGAWTDSAFWSRLAEFQGGYISQREPFLGVSEADRVGQYILAATATKVRGVWTRAERASQYGTFFTWPLHAGRCDPYNGDVAMTVSNTIGTGADALVWSAQKPDNIAWRAEQWISQFGYTSPIITSHNEPDGNVHWFCMYHPTNTGTVGKFSNQSIIDRPTAIARVRIALQQMWNAVQVGNRRRYIAVVTPPLSNAGAKKARSSQTCFTIYDMLTDSNGAILLAADGISMHTYDEGFRWDTATEADGNHSPWHYWQAIKQGQALAGITPRHFLTVNEGGIDENIQPPATRSQWTHAADYVANATEEQQGPNQAALLPARRRIKCIRAGSLPFWCAYWAVSFYTIYNFCSSGDDGMNLCPARDGYVPREPTWTAYRVLCDMDRYRVYGPGPWALTIASKVWADFSTNLTKATVGYHDPLTWIVLANFSDPEKANPNQATTRIYYEWDRATFASNALTFTAPVAGQGNQLNRAGRPVILPFHGDWKVTCNVAGNTGTARLIVRGYNKYDGTEQAIASTALATDILTLTFRHRPHNHPAVPNLPLVAVVLECTKAAVFSDVRLGRPGTSFQVVTPISGDVSLTAPVDNATVSGVAVTISADASFVGSSVAGVQFQVDGANVGSEVTAAPYSVTWDSTGATNGQHAISAVAREPGGLTVTDTISVTVSNASTAPSAAITDPVANAVVSGTIPVTATATFPGGTVESVQIRRDAVNLGALRTTSPYTLPSWNTASVTDGLHTLSAIATKVGGGSVTSPEISITISNDIIVPPPSTDLFANPFIADSAHHRPIGSGAILASGSHASIGNWAAIPQFTNVNVGSPFGRLVYEVTNASPRVTIAANPTHEDPYNDIPATNIAYPAGGVTFAGTTNNNDSVVVFINTDTGEHCEFRECGPGNTTRGPGNPMLAGSMHRSYVVQFGTTTGKNSGLGHGTVLGQRIGHSAAGVAAAFGLVRGAELTGADPIGHVFQFLVPGTSAQATAANSSQQIASKVIVLPATTKDGYASDAANANGEIPYGGVMTVADSYNINAQGFNAMQLKIAAAVRDYGLVMCDTAQGMPLRADQYVTDTQRNQIVACLNTMKSSMRLVLNSAWDPNDRRKPTGGGTPRAPNLAFDA